MLEHMPKDALKVIENDLLYSREKVKLPVNEDRRDEHAVNNKDTNNRTNDNLDERITKFQNQLKNIYWYRIPLKYLCDLGLVNTPIKFNTKWRLTFETDMQRLFESKTNQIATAGLPTSIDAKIIVDLTPYLLYYQFSLEDTFRTYFESTMVSENVLRTGIKFSAYQKSYQLVTGSQLRTITFNNAFKRFYFLEFSLVFNRSDLSIYDSYNAEVVATSIKTIKIQNASNTYSEFNIIKFNLEDEED